MKLGRVGALILVFLCSFAIAEQSRAAERGDAYFGYNRVGKGLYGNGEGMAGWQATVHIIVFRFIGAEGDVSHYSDSSFGYSQHDTVVMGGSSRHVSPPEG